ncbi:hypothetical protein HK105_207439 [Polyrhizophydium stewartii]|uniref:Ankyrin repeat protein n=1 Tax=Polyrhizophydium stewartii TaxID=2732419 RepID=A0ABR4N0R6_9FUNG
MSDDSIHPLQHPGAPPVRGTTDEHLVSAKALALARPTADAADACPGRPEAASEPRPPASAGESDGPDQAPSHWSRCPVEIRSKILEAAGAWTMFVSGALLRIDLLALSDHQRQKVWLDAANCNWDGDWSILPPLASYDRVVPFIHSRATLDRLSHLYPQHANLVARCVIRNAWMDLVDESMQASRGAIDGDQGMPRSSLGGIQQKELCLAAAQEGAEWIVKHADLFSDKALAAALLNAAAQHGQLGGNLDLVVWIAQAHPEACCQTAVDWAAAEGHLHVIKWLREHLGFECDPVAFIRAVEGGHVNLLSYMAEHFPHVIAQVNDNIAMKATHLGTLRLLHSLSKLVRPSVALFRCIDADTVDDVKWACESLGQRVTPAHFVAACRRNNAAMVKWMLTQPGVQFTPDAFKRAAAAHAVSVVKVAVAQNRDWLHAIQQFALKHSDFDWVDLANCRVFVAVVLGIARYGPRLIVDHRACAAAARSIVTSNRWVPLADLIDDESSNGPMPHDRFDQLCREFVDAANGTLDDLGIRKPARKAKFKPFRRAATKTAIKNRREALKRYQDLRFSPDATPDAIHLAHADFARLRDVARKLQREDDARCWRGFANRLGRLRSQDPRRFWASAKATLNLSRQSTANPAPLTDPATNSTCFDPQRICQIFGEHYKRLAADPTGHSTDPEHWPRVPFSRPDHCWVPPNRAAGLDRDIEWPEVVTALMAMAPGKAPGDDGIPTSLYRALLTYVPPADPSTPCCAGSARHMCGME